jgi:hypothetical protein
MLPSQNHNGAGILPAGEIKAIFDQYKCFKVVYIGILR